MSSISFEDVATERVDAYRRSGVGRKLEEVQLREISEFVRKLRALSSAPSDAEFSRRAGVHWAQFTKWKNASSPPDGWNLYLMIREAAKASQSEPVETAVAVGALEEQDPLDLLRGLSSVVAESQAANEAILDRLEKLERALEAPQIDGADPLSAGGGG